MLIYCTHNDRSDNSSNSGNDVFKPYLAATPDGGWQFRGLPVPKPPRVYFTENWLPRHAWLARLAVSVYVGLRHPKIVVPDPTEPLVDMMRGFVEAHGAKLLVGLTRREPRLEAFLDARGIAHTSFDGTDLYPGFGTHWTPKGHVEVAARLMALFAATGLAPEPHP